MNTFIFERSDTFRTRKTKRWFALLSFCFMLFMGQMGFAQQCEIAVTISSDGWGDAVTWQLRDSGGNAVLSGGTYSSGYSDTKTHQVTEGQFPFTLRIVHASNSFCDNDLNYSVTVAGAADIFGSLTDPCSGGTTDIPLNATACPACPAPTSLTAQVTPTSAALGWTGTGDFDIKWGASGFDVETGGTLVAGASNPYNLGGLTTNTTYDFYVRQDCDGDFSDWAGPFSFVPNNFVSIGTGVNTNTNIPVYTWYGYNASQQIVTASELGNPGTKQITKIRWYVDGNANLMSSSDNWQVYLGNTTKTNFASNTDWVLAGDMTQVFSGTVTAVNASWMEITLSSTFVYTGDNLVVAVSEVESGFAGSSSANTTFGSYTSATNTGIYIRNDSSPYNFTNSPGTGARTNTLARLQIELSEPPSCFPPTGLTAANLTYSSADLGWISDGEQFDIKWGTPGFDVEEEGALEEDFVSGATLSGLDSNTTYEFYVRQNCGEEMSVWAGPFEFMTACESISIFPWTENFEGITAPALPDCWGYIDANNDGDFWKTWTEYGVGSSNAVGLYTDFNSGNNNDYLILPQFTLTGNQRFKFSVRARSSNEPNDYRVVLSTTGNSSSDFINEILPLTVVSNTTHQEIDWIDLSAYSGDVYIAIHIPSGGLDGWYIYFDNFAIEENPSCIEPSALTATNLTYSSADLGWISDGEQFDIKWGTPGFDVETEGTLEEDFVSGATLSGLDSNTTYEFYVRQNCGEEMSDWAGPFSFTTPCAPATTGFSQDFDAGSAGTSSNPNLTDCWSFIDSGAGYGYVYNFSTPNTAPNHFYIYNSSDNAGDYILVSPPTDNLGNGEYWVKFYAKGSTNYTLQFGTLSDGTNAATFTVLETITLTSAYQEYIVALPAGTDDYFGFRHGLGGTYRGVYIDNIVYEEAPSCFPPAALTASNPTLTSIDLSWDGVGGASGNYEIKWGAVGFDIDAATAIPVTGLTYTLNGTGGNYQFVVREICSVNDASAWSTPYSFSIPNLGEDCSAPIVIGALPYTTTDDTANYTDNPNIEGVPGDCSTGSYLNGNDVVYAYTAAFDGVISVQLTELTATYSGIFAYASCADIGVACIGSAFGSGATDRGFEMNVADGDTYYFVISTWASPQTVGYTLDISQVLCPNPTGVAHTDVTQNSANVSWDVSGDYEINWGTGTFTAGDGDNTDTVNNTTEFAFSGLNGTTTYRYFVRQNCGGASGNSEWVGPFTFTTLVAPASIPWMEGFTTTTMPTGWAQTGFSFGAPAGITNAPGGVEGNVIYKNLYSSATSGNFQTINMGLVSSGDILSFIHRVSNWSSPYAPPVVDSGSFTVAVSINNGTDYADIDTITNDGVSEGWQSFEYDLSSYEGEYVRIRISATRTDGDYYLAFDNFYVGQPITCEAPTALTATNITTNTADLSWTSEGSTFDISWGAGAFDAEDGTIVALANGGTLSGLTAQTTYQYYVRQNCGVGDVSMWVGPFVFTTACEAFDLPYSQDFEGVTAPSLPSCTSIETLNGNPWRTSSSAVTGMTGNKLNYPWHASGTGTANAWFYTPGLNLEAGKNYAISYKYGNNTTYYTESMRVAYGTSASTSAMNEVLADHNAINTTTALENEVFFTVAEDGVYYFGFQSYSIADQNQLYVDDILIRELGDLCTGTPEAGIATASMSSGESGSAVDFAVTGYENDTDGISYDWEYSTDNGVTWSSAGVSDNEGTFTITGPIGTVFQVRYAVTCSFSESTAYSNIVTFTVTQPLNYCTPTYTYTGDRLSVVNTTGATSNLNYTSSVGAQHFDETAMVLEAAPGQEFTLNTTYVGGGQTVGVWIDWENNNTFDDLGNRIALNYSSSLTQSFTVTIPSDATPGDYRLRVRGSFSNHTADGDAFACNSKSYGSSIDFTIRVAAPCSSEWTGAVSTDWNTAGNWCDNTVPTAGSNVVIDSANPAVINTDVTVNSITLGADASLTVASNTSLTTGDITVANGGSFVIENNANLFQTAGAVNTGDVAVKRNSSLIKHLDYTLWSSPVAEQGLKAFSPQTIWYRIYTYNTTSDQWGQVFGSSEAPDTDFEAGVGYMFRAPNNFVTTPYTYNGEFTGTPNNGNVTVNFDATNGTYQGIGNPYPSNIKIEGPNGFWDTNSGTGTLYFWTNVNPWDDNLGDYTGNNWATFSKVGGVGTAGEGDSAENDASDKTPTGIIPVGQGFVIESGSENSVTFTNDMRTSDAGVFFKMLDQDKGRLWLDLSEGSQELNQVLIGYVSGASQGYDFGYDSEMFGYVGSALYSLIGNNEVNYTIQGRALPFDDNDEVPLGFRANNGGSFTISLNNFDGLFIDENQDIFLKDNLTGEEHNLKNDAYSFVSEEGTFNSRFSIVYKEAGSLNVSTPDLNNNWVVFKQNEMFRIQTQGFDMSEVTVYDILGRVVYTSEAEGNNHTISRIDANQVLIVKVTTSDNQVLTKKVNN